MSNYVNEYLNGLKKTIDNMPVAKIQQAIDILHEAYENDRFIFVLGNGGSASTSSHFMIDQCKQTRSGHAKFFKAISLSDNIPSITAWANDQDYADVFVEQLRNLHSPNCVVIGISASGNSENVLRALKFAKEKGSPTIGLTGFDGGKLKDIVDVAIIAPSNIIGQVEDIHLALVHIFGNACQQRISAKTT